MAHDMRENPESPQNEAVRLPLWLKLSCVIVAATLLFFLVKHYLEKDNKKSMIHENTVAVSPDYPIELATEWEEVALRIDSIVRIDDQTIVAEWAYCNNSQSVSESFSWGFSQPNYVELTKIIDADGHEYPVVTNKNGDPICASTNTYENSDWSKEIFGGRDLPVWAKFTVPVDVPKPLRISFYGLNNNGSDNVEVNVLGIDEQYERAFLPRATNWPDIFIQLVDINRQDAENTIEVKWKYLNKNKNNRFLWGLDQPNYVAYTQIYDYSTGKYHNVARKKVNGVKTPVCTNTNKDINSGWSHSIEPDGELEASALFKGIEGKNIQILFHSAMPLFYNPEKIRDEQPKTN